MKFSKLTKKLLLSALSLGLAVVTLTTTTYAWFTSSTEASATGSGTTSGTTKDSTLMISTDGINWGKTATIDASSVDLVPVVWESGTSFKDAKNVASTGYYSFTVQFKTSKTFDAGNAADIAVYLKNLQITNVTNKNDEGNIDLVEFDNLLAEADKKGTLDANTYAVDVVRALDMVITNNNTSPTTKAYELSDQFNYATSAESGFTHGTANAATYYDGVMGDGSFEAMPDNGTLTPVTIDKTTNVGEITTGTTPQYVQVGLIEAGDSAYVNLSVTFYIYLNGADNYCFDACKGQEFEISLEFTTNPKSTTPAA